MTERYPFEFWVFDVNLQRLYCSQKLVLKPTDYLLIISKQFLDNVLPYEAQDIKLAQDKKLLE